MSRSSTEVPGGGVSSARPRRPQLGAQTSPLRGKLLSLLPNAPSRPHHPCTAPDSRGQGETPG